MTEDNRETHPEEPARSEAPASQGTPPTDPAPHTDHPPTAGSSTDWSAARADQQAPAGSPAAHGGRAGSEGAAASHTVTGSQSATGTSYGEQPTADMHSTAGSQPLADSHWAAGSQLGAGSEGTAAPHTVAGSQSAPSAGLGAQPPAGETIAYGHQAPFAPGAQATGPAQSTASFASSGDETPPRGYPAQTERVLYGTAFNQGGGLGTPPRSGYPTIAPPGGRPPSEARRRPSGLVAGLTVLALLVGGGAGAAGGYLVAENNASNAPVANALDEPPPTEQTSDAPAGSIESVAERLLPSVVQLQVRGGRSAGEGSGFVISTDGLIVTNNHVVEAAADGGQIVAVFHDGSTASAEIVGRDPTSDVAVVRADKDGLQEVRLGRSDDLQVGEGVVAFGSPFELSGTVTSGIVSSLHRPTRAGGEDGSQATVMDAIQTDAAINPGNSGGPLVNMRGEVVGINSAIYSPTQSGSIGIGFAIPIDQARRTADEIVKTGKATQTVLGVTVRDNEDGGALIVDVTADGPGAKAGLRQGDVVTKLDERRIPTSDALVAAVRSHKPGDRVKLELSNGSRTVDATLAGQQVETE